MELQSSDQRGYSQLVFPLPPCYSNGGRGLEHELFAGMLARSKKKLDVATKDSLKRSNSFSRFNFQIGLLKILRASSSESNKALNGVED